MAKDSRLERAGVQGYNKPKRTPNHPTKSHVVVAKEGDQVKTIRFGQQGVRVHPRVLHVTRLSRPVMQLTLKKVRCPQLIGQIR